MQLLAIFEKNGEAQVTEHFFKTMTRKFRASCKVGAAIGYYCYYQSLVLLLLSITSSCELKGGCCYCGVQGFRV